jgi:hypothetical protein
MGEGASQIVWQSDREAPATPVPGLSANAIEGFLRRDDETNREGEPGAKRAL